MKKIFDAAQILNSLREKIIQTLSNDRQDGLDCLVCVINNKTKELNFAGANSRFFVAHKNNNTLSDYKTDKMPVGKSPKQNELFSSNSLQLNEGDVIYSFTDGYADQFGGPKNKKVEEKIKEIVNESLSFQEEQLKKLFSNWKGDKEQTDYVTFIAIRI